MPRPCELRDLGCLRYAEALAIQRDLVDRRKRDEIPDQFLLVEHPHVITLGRNAKDGNVLASDEELARLGIEKFETNRGGDVTYHGPGQLVGYPILDLRLWKRDVVAYVRALEQVLIDALAEFGQQAERSPGHTGVWVRGGKVAAIGVHISRWVTMHGFALNVETDLRCFRHIVPCGLTLPVTSLRELGCGASRGAVAEAIGRHFELVFDCRLEEAATQVEVVTGDIHG